MDSKGYILEDQVPVRHQSEFTITDKHMVDFVGISPIQIISIATALIPFIEHDDANRALWARTCNVKLFPWSGLNLLGWVQA